MKMNRNFDAFADFESLKLEVPIFFCLATGCVSARRDRRYKEERLYRMKIAS
jgi:hypothetical protein